MKLKASDVTVERNIYGAWVCSALVNGYLRTCRYIGYTKRAAIRDFVRMINTETKL